MLLGPLAASAEVATDGTLGAKVRLTGRDVKVPARLGQVRSKNLLKADQAKSGPAWPDERIVAALEVGSATVQRLRRRFVEEGL